MRIKSYFLFIFPLILLLLASCNPSSTPKEKYYSSTKTTNLELENVKSASVGSSKYDVASCLRKKPKFIEVTEQPPYTTYIYGKSTEKYDVEFEIVDNKVSRYDLISSKYSTEKGIHTGDSKKDVIRAYGENYYEREDTGATIIGYFDKNHKLNIEFSLDDKDKVGGILVQKTNN
ncbi:hypothetical protein [Priestia megaterium]|uniref:hypothetical protein n=1 Tax=Priestia megaterium TaxID=1404 RepID=UPI000D51CA2F|nr:hypothetical protein [Priestia megaterium]PVE75002.1 hypothetical protein DC428_03590 [Priestia megaterium]PVE84736.1 hypothetical protein DC421_14980 [Priestia megaterium]PVE88164.1 hypothetical protein DC426_13620 [Priestia megaterium]PVF00300.1 hypothetical protein DC433_09425 [Priestia megaterium]